MRAGSSACTLTTPTRCSAHGIRSARSAAPWEREYRLLHHSGEYRWIVDRGVPRYEGGRYVGYVGTAIDIHERKTMEGRLLEVYQREHKIAETLQRSLLPERLPQIEGLQLAARYLPGARGAAIGGDWYDVLERPDGRVALVVGDVVGHGLRAAATMGQLRNAFRAYGLVESSPAEVVARINRLVMSGVEDAMATVVYLVLDRETGEVVLQLRRAPAPARAHARRAALPRGRALGADRSFGPRGVPRGERRAPARLRAPALHGRPRRAPRRGPRGAPRSARGGGRFRRTTTSTRCASA